jgi:hypothetical protein
VQARKHWKITDHHVAAELIRRPAHKQSCRTQNDNSQAWFVGVQKLGKEIPIGLACSNDDHRANVMGAQEPRNPE